eukprot:747590-Hanusia_phi.AAC.1
MSVACWDVLDGFWRLTCSLNAADVSDCNRRKTDLQRVEKHISHPPRGDEISGDSEICLGMAEEHFMTLPNRFVYSDACATLSTGETARKSWRRTDRHWCSRSARWQRYPVHGRDEHFVRCHRSACGCDHWMLRLLLVG